MKKLTLRFKLFAGLLLSQFNANASSSFEIDFDEFKVTDQNNVNYMDISYDGVDYNLGNNDEATKDLFTSGCDRLIELENKVDLKIGEIEEGVLLDEMIGEACHNPQEYKMASIAHKIKEL